MLFRLNNSGTCNYLFFFKAEAVKIDGDMESSRNMSAWSSRDAPRSGSKNKDTLPVASTEGRNESVIVQLFQEF